MSKNDPAFDARLSPNAGVTRVDYITIRDYFAAKAMQATIGNTSILAATAGPKDDHDVAHLAYAMADAMCEERGK